MHNSTTLIAPQIYRLTLAPNPHFEFSQFLIQDEKNCLVHTGKEAFFEPLLQMAKQQLNGCSLDYIVFSHFEADECGSVNSWLKAYPNATVVCNKVANINLADFLIRPATVLKDGQCLALGKRNLQLIETPHFPHNWDAHMWYETTDRILFSSDFCCQGNICEPLVKMDITESIINFCVKGGFIPYGKTTNEALEKISMLDMNVIAPMHGSVISGDICRQVFSNIRADLIQRSLN